MKGDLRLSHREPRPRAAGAVGWAWWHLLPGTAACSKGWPLAPCLSFWSWCPCRAAALLVLFMLKQVNVVFCVEATGLNIHKLFTRLCTAKPSFLKESLKGAGTLELYFISCSQQSLTRGDLSVVFVFLRETNRLRAAEGMARMMDPKPIV